MSEQKVNQSHCTVSLVIHSSSQQLRERVTSSSEQLEKENKELRAKLEKVVAERDSLRHTSQELSKQEVGVVGKERGGKERKRERKG